MFIRTVNILITGASSGLGKALAIKYAKLGVTNLYLTGRNSKNLFEVKKICESNGSVVYEKSIDITDAKAFSLWVDSIYANGGKIDLVIANAGISAGTGGIGEGIEQVRKIFSTNIDGVINTIHPVIEYMKQEKSGQIAIISSLAGYRGIPGSPAYSASKAAVKVYGEGLRGVLAKDGIGLTVITPGYIKTPMTDINEFPMPFLMDAKQAARIIIKKLKRNPARIAFPWRLYAIIWFLSILPPCYTDWLFAKMPGKKSL